METEICHIFYIYPCFDDHFSLLYDGRFKLAILCIFFKYRPLVDNEHVGKIQSPMVEQDGAIIMYYVLCLSVTKLFLVLFKYCIVIIKKVEMLYVVLNITARYASNMVILLLFL